MGLRLATFPHHRLAGSNRYRLRVGDYRIIYTFDAAASIIHLLAVGHRRENLSRPLSLARHQGRLSPNSPFRFLTLDSTARIL